MQFMGDGWINCSGLGGNLSSLDWVCSECVLELPYSSPFICRGYAGVCGGGLHGG